jgi:DNA-binding SARP family transcriptional activator
MAQTRTPPLIQRKVRLPDLEEGFVDRPRVRDRLARLIDERRFVVVSATAGAGKTSAVASAVRQLGCPAAWLSVDQTDASPGRLVTYLEAALSQCLPALVGVATQALSAGIAHAEAAGLLADSVGDDALVLVLDNLERLGDRREAWEVLEALARYAPPTLTIVAVSRRDIPGTLAALHPAGLGVLGEPELAFTSDEAADALTRAGKPGIDPAAAVRATGGWVTGVLFEAWRSEDHVAGGGGEGDPLYGYLSSQILDQLAIEDRDFLIATSLLDEVDAGSAQALGLQRAGERLQRLRAAHLPVSWDAGGRVMRCHPRFREYLHERLERAGEDEMRSLRIAHARRLAAESNDEDATEEFLRGGSPGEALATAERAIFTVIERGDFAIAERWLNRLAAAAAASGDASRLTAAELMLALTREDLRRVVEIADALASSGARDALAGASDIAAWTMTWAYISTGRPGDVAAVLRAARPGPSADAARYSSQVMINPADGPLPRAPLLGGPIDALVYVADYSLGYLAELAEEPGSRYMELVKRQWRVAALRAMGRTEQALELLGSIQDQPGTLSLQAWIGPLVLIDAGQGERARAQLALGRRLARDSGQLAVEAMNRLAAAKLALRIDRDSAAARAILDEPEQQQIASRFNYIGEAADMWYGLALLHESQDGEALTRLRRAVQGMVAGDRFLELPTAAVYLAEAEWRAGDEQAADAAADLALTAAARHGSRHTLLQALAEFPAVASRRIDAEPGAGSPWHELGRRLRARGASLATTLQASVEIREFGDCRIFVDGEEVRPRIRRAYELLALLATRQPHVATRDELLEALFDGSDTDSARSYLRQAVHWLRQVLPENGISGEGGAAGLSDAIAVTSESIRFETQLAAAAGLPDGDRLTATLDALRIYDKGEYLPGRRSQWGDQRQRDLAAQATDARYEAAELSLAAGDYQGAETLAMQVLASEPCHEAAWRLMMRVADALGDEAAVVRAFHDCERSLAEIGVGPSPTTRRLLEQLRR